MFSSDDQKVIREKGGGVLLFGDASLGEGGAAAVGRRDFREDRHQAIINLFARGKNSIL